MKVNILREYPDLLTLDYHTDSNQKGDAELLSGESTCEIVQDLKPVNRNEFFSNVQIYFMRFCDNMFLKFPFLKLICCIILI